MNALADKFERGIDIGNVTMVKSAIESGYTNFNRPNEFGFTPLFLTLKNLLERDSGFGANRIKQIADNTGKRLAVFKLLIEKGANVNDPVMIRYILERPATPIDFLYALIDGGLETTPEHVFIALVNNRSTIAKQFLMDRSDLIIDASAYAKRQGRDDIAAQIESMLGNVATARRMALVTGYKRAINALPDPMTGGRRRTRHRLPRRKLTRRRHRRSRRV